jgi:hypothetical protein
MMGDGMVDLVMRRTAIGGLALATLLVFAAPARADITVFLGRSRNSSATPNAPAVSQGLKGAAFGIGLLVVGFEVEGALHTEDPVKGIPGLKTGMGNVLVQTPTGNVQLYGTAGGGLFQETLGTSSETNFVTNIGGGIKMGIFGPIRLRADYRMLNLHGTPHYKTVQRFYVGASLKF